MWKVPFLMRVAKLDALPSISGPPSVQKLKVFFPKFYLAKNIFTILKMPKAFRASRRTHKIRILPWWYQNVYRKQREGAGYTERYLWRDISYLDALSGWTHVRCSFNFADIIPQFTLIFIHVHVPLWPLCSITFNNARKIT